MNDRHVAPQAPEVAVDDLWALDELADTRAEDESQDTEELDEADVQ